MHSYCFSKRDSRVHCLNKIKSPINMTDKLHSWIYKNSPYKYIIESHLQSYPDLKTKYLREKVKITNNVFLKILSPYFDFTMTLRSLIWTKQIVITVWERFYTRFPLLTMSFVIYLKINPYYCLVTIVFSWKVFSIGQVLGLRYPRMLCVKLG